MKKVITILTTILSFPAVALAENKLGTPISGPEGIIQFVQAISNWVFAFLLAVAVLYVLLAAYQYLSSKGGEGVETAHKMLTYAAVAVAVAVLAKGIVFVAASLAGQTITL